MIAYQVGKHELAAQYIERAIRLGGNAAVFHNNLGEAYRALRRTSAAVASYRRALELRPDYAEALSNLRGNGVSTLKFNFHGTVASCDFTEEEKGREKKGKGRREKGEGKRKGKREKGMEKNGKGENGKGGMEKGWKRGGWKRGWRKMG